MTEFVITPQDIQNFLATNRNHQCKYFSGSTWGFNGRCVHPGLNHPYEIIEADCTVGEQVAFTNYHCPEDAETKIQGIYYSPELSGLSYIMMKNNRCPALSSWAKSNRLLGFFE